MYSLFLFFFHIPPPIGYPFGNFSRWSIIPNLSASTGFVIAKVNELACV